MFLPLGDSPNARGVPWITYGLLLANVAVFVLTLPMGARGPDPTHPLLPEYVELIRELAGARVSVREVLTGLTALDLWTFEHGFRPSSPSLASLFSSMFLHGSFLHLAGNMLFLWIYGDNVEHHLGRLRFLLAYLACGILATLAHAALSPGSQLPVIGASGAISGVLGLYFLLFPRNRVRLLVVLFPFFVNVLLVPARIVIGLYVVVDNILPLLASTGAQTGGVAYGAHLGGFFAGLIGAKALEFREERGPRAREPKGDALDVSETLTLAESIAAERPDEALALARRVLRRTARERRIPGSAAAVQVARAHLLAAAIRLEIHRQPAAAWHHLLESLEATPTGPLAEQARRMLARIQGSRPPSQRN